MVTRRSSISGLFKHTFVYGLSDLARKLVGFLLIPIYTRYMSPSEYGILQLSLLFVAFWQILYSFGMTTAFFRFYLDTKDGERKKLVFSTTLWSMVIIDAMLSVVMLFFSDNVSTLLFGGPEHERIVIVVIMVLMVESIVQVPLLLLRALDRSRTFLFFVCTQLFVALAANFLLVVVYRLGPLGAMVANLTASSLLLLLLIPTIRGTIRLCFSREVLGRLLRYGLPFVPSAISMMVMNISDQYLLRYFRGLEETGLYALSYKFGMAINLFITGFRYAWVPFIFRVSDEPDAERMYARAFEITAAILSLFFFLICAFLPEIYRVLVEKSYFTAMGIVPLVAMSYILFGFHIIFLAGIYLEDRTAYIAKVAAVAALVNILTNMIFIPRYGIWGAAATTFFSFSILLTLIYRKAQQVHRIPFDITRAARILFLAVAVMSAARMIEFDSRVLVLGSKLLLTAVYLMILRAMGFLSRRKMREVANWLK